MAKIHYYLSGGKGEWINLSNENEYLLEFSFTPAIDGYIKLKDTIYRVKSGELSVPINDIPDGKYALRLECKNGGFTLEEFNKSSGCIKMSKTGDEAIRSMLTRLRRAEEKIHDMEEKISVLIKKTEGHHIFN